MKNLINKLTFEVDCPSENEAFGIQHDLTQILQTELEAGIDSICSKHTQEVETVHIDKLELDLGQFNTYTFDRHILDTFLTKFEEALLTELAELPDLNTENSQSYSPLDTLIYFLETGQKPWWGTNQILDLNASFIRYLREDKGALITFLQHQLNNDSLWQRISLQFNIVSHEKLIARTPNLKLAASLIIRYAEEISEVVGINMHPQKKDAVNRLVIANRTILINEVAISKQSLALFRAHIQQLLENVNPDEMLAIEQIAEALIKGKIEVLEVDSNTKRLKDKIRSEDNQKFLSNHGGAVILAQFLKPLFKNLGFFIDGEWIDEERQFKAMHLINYLCTGKESAMEFDLNIEKLLCGLPLNAPLPQNAHLTADEMREADLLLESIIEHWGVLKNTSINGLRKAFLLRECIITDNNTDWQINMERKTADVLLDKLPWGFSVIILPWNDYQIYVEW
ncbi:contractile injection system tape measure protein [Cellulophaga baltica]|uniref:contractile injection system tape measure protein n=1 Tax=Cellulophaga baltica TaxID=76594 RepID=UPI002147A5D1|nr:contractile injection system tape measure protein [Cellulophaga baltica]MCR1024517.1 contractile injection system tape measure protein [Cellulophaga baltica]